MRAPTSVAVRRTYAHTTITLSSRSETSRAYVFKTAICPIWHLFKSLAPVCPSNLIPSLLTAMISPVSASETLQSCRTEALVAARPSIAPYRSAARCALSDTQQLAADVSDCASGTTPGLALEFVLSDARTWPQTHASPRKDADKTSTNADASGTRTMRLPMFSCVSIGKGRPPRKEAESH